MAIKINILLVDDDQTCLNIASEHLQKLNHHVVAMSKPEEALELLRKKYDAFDLLLTDVHMPQMTGIDLLRHVKDESHLPVVLMSADVDKDIMLQGLQEGASFYLVKPVTVESLAKLWQFAIYAKGFSSIGVQNIINNNNNNNNGNRNGNKRPKLVWTTSLHNLFLEAINRIGMERAVPKRILQYMNIPGLRRENVASHLQKYRIFLRRIVDASRTSEGGIPTGLTERPLRSSFVMNEISYLTNNFQQQYQDLIVQTARAGNRNGQEGVVVVPTPNMTTATAAAAAENNNNGGGGGGRGRRIQGSNYVGLRISANGELMGTLNDIAAARAHQGLMNYMLCMPTPSPPIGMINREMAFGRDLGLGLEFGFGYNPQDNNNLDDIEEIDEGLYLNDDMLDDDEQDSGENDQDGNSAKSN